MAFLVGVRETRVKGHPHPARHDHLAPPVEIEAGLFMAGPSDGAPPSPLEGEVNRGWRRKFIDRFGNHFVGWVGRQR